MPSSGLFITLFDEDTLELYLNKGIYGFHMPPVFNEVSSRSPHYRALADYACAREGTQVFFFLNRTIIYGGQIIGSSKYGAFYLNGDYSPMGRKAKAKVYWDESIREIYSPTGKSGIFTRPEIDEEEDEYCQPYLIKFKDKLGLIGKAIESDQLYFELGEYPYPLPSNSISGMSFCTLTPGETELALSLLEEQPIDTFSSETDEDIDIRGKPIAFSPRFGISDLEDVISESHLEANVIANPDLLANELRPRNDAICRQIPISPFKPAQMDRADICYYSDDEILNGTIPNTIIELKNRTAGINECQQIVRYLKWLHKRLKKKASEIQVYMLAPSYARTFEIPDKYKGQVENYTFDDM